MVPLEINQPVYIKVYYNVTLLIPLETDVEPLYGSIELTRA